MVALFNTAKNFLKNNVNTAFQSLFFLASKNADKALPNGTALVIAPHPDDESLGCGATLLRLRTQGVKVRIVIVTNGAASTPASSIAPEKLAAIRRTEAQKAAHLLNIPETELVFLSYPDGEASAHIDKITKDLAAQIWLASPSLIFAPYDIDAHPDHRTVAQAVARLREEGKISCRVFEYPMWFWPYGAITHLYRSASFHRHKISTTGFLEAKKQAILAHRSQFENLMGSEDWHTLDPGFLSLALRPFELFFERKKK